MNRILNDLKRRTKRLERSIPEPLTVIIYHEENGEKVVHYRAIIQPNIKKMKGRK